MNPFVRMLVVVGLVMVGGAWAQAEEAPTGSTGAAMQAPMDPAMAEKMEQMKALTSPLAAHKVLEPFVGRWTYAGEFRMTPDAAPEAMTGTADMTMIYDGRFLQQTFEGPWMGQAFHGMGYTGYDNIKAQYVSIWLDNMSTGIMTTTGFYNEDTRTLHQSGNHSCPLTGETDRRCRSEWTVVDDNHHTYTSYTNGPDGLEYKAMEITYTRAE